MFQLWCITVPFSPPKTIVPQQLSFLVLNYEFFFSLSTSLQVHLFSDTYHLNEFVTSKKEEQTSKRRLEDLYLKILKNKFLQTRVITGSLHYLHQSWVIIYATAQNYSSFENFKCQCVPEI